MSLSDAVVGLKAYKEVDERMEQLWRNVDGAVVARRMDPLQDTLPSVHSEGEVLELTGQAERNVESLLSDLEKILIFLAQRLPSDLMFSLSNFMMADVVPRLINRWLNPGVPSSLKDIDRFQSIIQRAGSFCETLDSHGYSDLGELKDWVGNAPTIWLGRCRETTLDTVRQKLSDGIGESKRVEKIEKQMVSLAEGKELTKTPGAGASADNNDWGADWGDAWDEDQGQINGEPDATETRKAPSSKGDDDGADAWGWDDDTTNPSSEETKDTNDEDDAAAAWGWGEEDTTQETAPQPERTAKGISKTAEPQTRELVLKETYSISSMPEPVLELITTILEDGAALTSENHDYALVAATAPGLFSLPTFILALFRAISPYYYSLDVGGNM